MPSSGTGADADPFVIGTLRSAIQLANASAGANEIRFDTAGVFATPQIITLGGTQLPTITDDLTITGTGAANLTIDADGQSRIFNLDDGDNMSHVAVELVAMTLTGGNGSGTFPADEGGAIFSLENLLLRDSVVSGNSANNFGGGIASFNFGTTTIQSSTLTGNSAEYGRGGGIYSRNYSMTSLTSSIVAGNMATNDAPDLRSFDETETVTTSLIGDNTGSGLAEDQTGESGNFVGTTANPIGPLLGPLDDNGGPTLTHALLPNSPAIDAGDPAAVAGMNGVPEFDQRGPGFARVSGGRIDMGAFGVHQQGPALPGDYNQNGSVDAADYAVWRDTLGQSVAAFEGADGSGNGVVDQADYDVWVDHFGAVLPPATASGALSTEPVAIDVVNEPASEPAALPKGHVATSARFDFHAPVRPRAEPSMEARMLPMTMIREPALSARAVDLLLAVAGDDASDDAREGDLVTSSRNTDDPATDDAMALDLALSALDADF